MPPIWRKRNRTEPRGTAGHVKATISGTLEGGMAENSKIEWTDHTWNPWIGCEKISPACDYCYAAELAGRYRWVEWGGDRKRTSPSTWAQPRKLDRKAAQAGRVDFVFCLSLGDIWDNDVPPPWRRDAFDVMRETPNLLYLLLSKRIGNAEKMAAAAGGLPSNTALGATMVTQHEYDRDRLKLKRAGEALGARFTFASIEPMLGPVILDKNAPDWIIVGGESGKNARPMNLEWARSLKRQSAELGRIFNFKQVGGRTANKGGHDLDGETYFARPLAA
jgi:protein gp37